MTPAGVIYQGKLYMIEMPIDKAIQLLKLEYAEQRWNRHPDQKLALFIAIDGLERIKAYRETHLHIWMMPLKGEQLP